jgi:hypothetical protein
VYYPHGLIDGIKKFPLPINGQSQIGTCKSLAHLSLAIQVLLTTSTFESSARGFYGKIPELRVL